MNHNDTQLSPAVARLREGLAAVNADDELAAIDAARDAVIARFGGSFAPQNLAALTADEYVAFLRFDTNRHWSGIHRYGPRTTRDMDALRRALATLLDESRPLAERYDEATGGLVVGLGRAVATPILHVVYPERYGVWNGKSEAGLRALGLYPTLGRRATDGEMYAAVNKVLLRLAAELGVHLWTVDTLWEWLGRQESLAAPFNAIFADRAQAEWAFDLFAETVQRLGGGPEDRRFALTLANNKKMLRLNFGQWLVIDFSAPLGRFALALPIAPVEALGFTQRDLPFEADPNFAVFHLPIEAVRPMSPEMRQIYEASMDHIGRLFQSWAGSPFRRAHQPEIFAALFDVDKRRELLDNGLGAKPTVEQVMNVTLPPIPNVPTIAREFKGFSADAFAFLTELRANNNAEWMNANQTRWQDSVREPMRALFTDLGPILKAKFDPYLAPDELAIEPKFGKTLATIKKRWPDDDGPYHDYYWGAFYRVGLAKQSDAQLFIIVAPQELRCGFYLGQRADKIVSHFRNQVLSAPTRFLELISELGLTNDFEFVREHTVAQPEAVAINSPQDLNSWMETGNFDLLCPIPANEAITRDRALADWIVETFRRVFPVYLWAVLDDPAPVVERYLAAEFPTDELEDDEIEPPPPPYTFADFTAATHLSDEAAEELGDMLREKRQVIFYGPPGTGKTYVAQALARLMTGLAEPPAERLAIVQFHPAYGYEEFIEGIRPESVERGDGHSAISYPARPGVFVEFCRAAAQIGAPCVFIVDEINRGNIPRIFGELMLLLEYRGLEVRLPYSGKPFRIPPNVYLIGTMNTADRSIALVDFALRRRFHFAHFTADADLFDRWLEGQPDPLPYLGALYRRLAEEAIEDANFAIGPSAFMRPGLDEGGLRRVWQRSVMPYLEEYYLDQPARATRWQWDGELLRGLRGEWS